MTERMLQIALVNPAQSGHYPQPPMGLALLAAILEKEGHKVTVLDTNALRLRPDEVPHWIADARVVGITAMTPTIGAAAAIARRLKQARPGLPIILGGAHATLLPEETLQNTPEVDIIARGEAEKTIVELLRAMENEEGLARVPGITYRRKGEIVSNKAATEDIDLDTLPFLAYHLLPWQKYRPHPPHGRANPFAAIITSRGCPYRCSYCSKPVFGTKFRAQSPERVVEEIAYHHRKFGVREFAFYDDVFTLNKNRAHAIADGIIKARLKICWTNESRVNLVDRELLKHMRKAGCYAIAYGIESASQEILQTLNKDITPEQVEEAIAITRGVGIQTIGYFMLGSPGETPDTIQKTIEFARKLKLDFAQFSVTTPFPGTKLYELYLKEAKGQPVPWESFVYAGVDGQVTPVFETGGLDRQQLNYWVRKAYKDFYARPSYLWQRIKRLRSAGDLRVNINGLSMLMDSLKSQKAGK